ncbi:MAG: hypothetical protein ACE15E_20495 [Acidobacteriota bacterium]
MRLKEADCRQRRITLDPYRRLGEKLGGDVFKGLRGKTGRLLPGSKEQSAFSDRL